MDSTAEDSQNSKRARLAPPGDVDRISGLDEGVILRILELVADARDAVRTGVLSRRWLGLWTRVPALRFVSPPVSTAASGDEQCAALERYVSFVNGVLARRTESDCTIQCLAILYTAMDSARNNLEQLRETAADAAQGWIQYAFQNGVKSLDVDLRLPPKRRDDDDDHVDDEDEGDDDHSDDDEGALVIMDELLPSPEKLESMRLALGGARLRLPTTMKFASLVDLSLEKTKIAAGGAHLLARLISSTSCPCLRKLRMSKLFLPSLNEEMKIDAVLLSELWIEDSNMRSLELRTPSLRVFHVDTCCDEVLRVSAPRLEELAFFQRGYPPRRLEVDGDLTNVRNLKLYLSTRTLPCYEIDGDTNNILLLKHCSSVTCLEVTLEDEKVRRLPIRGHVAQIKLKRITYIVSTSLRVKCN